MNGFSFVFCQSFHSSRAYFIEATPSRLEEAAAAAKEEAQRRPGVKDQTQLLLQMSLSFGSTTGRTTFPTLSHGACIEPQRQKGAVRVRVCVCTVFTRG